MVDVVDRSAYAAAPLKRISWGAIVAGTILALVFQVMLALLGLGIGLATLDPQAGGDNPALSTFTSVGGIWAVLTVLIATFLGAFAAARFAGSASKRDAALHGVTTWATATLVAVYLLTSGASALVTSAFGALGSTVSSLGSAVQAVVPNSIDALPPELQEARRAAGRAQGQRGIGGAEVEAGIGGGHGKARGKERRRHLGQTRRRDTGGGGRPVYPIDPAKERGGRPSWAGLSSLPACGIARRSARTRPGDARARSARGTARSGASARAATGSGRAGAPPPGAPRS